jgi:hypothetical protein
VRSGGENREIEKAEDENREIEKSGRRETGKRVLKIGKAGKREIGKAGNRETELTEESFLTLGSPSTQRARFLATIEHKEHKGILFEIFVVRRGKARSASSVASCEKNDRAKRDMGVALRLTPIQEANRTRQNRVAPLFYLGSWFLGRRRPP